MVSNKNQTYKEVNETIWLKHNACPMRSSVLKHTRNYVQSIYLLGTSFV